MLRPTLLRGLVALTLVLASSACDCGGTGVKAADGVLASPPLVDFGDVVVGSERTISLELSVQGAGEVTLLSARIEGPGVFTAATSPDVQRITAGERAHLALRFAPTALGPAEAVLHVENDSTKLADLQVPLRGRGVAPGSCDDQVSCTEDASDGAGGCTHTPKDTLCETNDHCAILRCDAAQGCVSAGTVSCDDHNPCTDDSCDSAQGCVHPAAANGTSCTGEGACNGDFVCQSGACTCRPKEAVGSGHVYPIAWPKAGGGMMVAVPVEQTRVQVYHMVGAPHGSAFNRAFPTTPESTISPANADEPIVLWAPTQGSDPTADEDHFYILVSEHPLVISMADDERHQPGSPDRIFFMPSTTGTFRGRTFYSQANGGDPSERLRVMNLGAQAATIQLFAWDGGAWNLVTTATAQPQGEAVLTPNVPMAPYKVVSSEDATVLVGYVVDNATAPAVDEATGMTSGSKLLGYGNAWHLRAIQPLSYVVESRATGSWTQVAQGTLAANEAAGQTVPNGEGWLRFTLTGGTGWAIAGTPSLLQNTEWNGYFLPAQDAPGCFVGARFFTNSASRVLSVIPNAGTTVTVSDEASGAVLDTFTSTGAWEFHNTWSAGRAKVDFSGGPGAVILVGSLNWGGCDEASNPGNCGILEGGYSIPAASGFRCRDDTSLTLTSCRVFAGQDSCAGAP